MSGTTVSDARVLSIVEKLPKPEFTWSPEELLVAFLEDIRSGKAKPMNLFVAYWQDDEGRIRPYTWTANCSNSEAIALCTLEIQRIMDAWRGQ